MTDDRPIVLFCECLDLFFVESIEEAALALVVDLLIGFSKAVFVKSLLRLRLVDSPISVTSRVEIICSHITLQQ
jgi:hypothetical protein